MTTWNDIRRSTGDALLRDDYRLLRAVAAGRVRLTETGVDMQSRPRDTSDKRVTTAKLRRLSLVVEVTPGDIYTLTAAGAQALDEWLS